VNVGAGVHAAAGDDRDRAAATGLERTDLGDHVGDDPLQRVRRVVDLLRFEAQVAAGQRALHHHRVGHVAVALPPVGEDQARRPTGAHDGGDLDVGRPQRRHRDAPQRQAGAKEDDVGPLLHDHLEQLVEVVHRHHQVDPDHPAGAGAGAADLAPERPLVGGAAVVVVVRLDHPDGVGGDDADSAGFGHGGRQPRQRDAHAHAALHDGHRGPQVTDGQRRQILFRCDPFGQVQARQLQSG